MSGVICRSLLAKVTLPCTVERSGCASGTARRNRNSALPEALALANGWPMAAATGLALNTASDSASGPRT